MSETTAGGGVAGGGGELQEAASATDLPERPNVIVEETSGKKDCWLRYQYDVEKGDQVSVTYEDANDREGHFYIMFTVKRFNSERVVFSRRSKPIPIKLKADLVIKDEDLDLKKKMYIIKLKKQSEFNLDTYFRPDSPPL